MPTKHIDDTTWKAVERETVKAVTATQSAIKDSEVLKLLILIGIENVTDDDYKKLAGKK